MYVYAYWFWKLFCLCMSYKLECSGQWGRVYSVLVAAVLTLSIFVPHLKHFSEKWETDLMLPPTEGPEPAVTAVEEG